MPWAERYKDDHFDAVFTSDLARTYRSAEIGFGGRWPIIHDKRFLVPSMTLLGQVRLWRPDPKAERCHRRNKPLYKEWTEGKDAIFPIE